MKKFISIILSIILFITYFIFMAHLNFSVAFSKKSINKVIDDIKFTEQISQAETSPKKLEWDMMLNEMYDVAEDYDISRNEVDEIIESESAKEFILNYMENNTNYILNSDETSKIQTEDLQKEIEDAINNYVENENTDLTQSQKQKIYNFSKENSYKIAEKLPTPEDIEVHLSKEVTNFAKIFFSLNTRIILITIIAISIISIILLQQKKRKWLLYLGTTLLISNISTLLFSLTISPIMNFILDSNTSIIMNLFKNFSKQIVNPYLIISSIGIVFSIILLVIYNKIKGTK